MLPTTLAGTVTSTSATAVTLNLLTVDGRPVSQLDFAGTGATSSQDANAAAYTVALPASVSTSSLSSGSPVSLTGFVTPFGSAPPDFTASSLSIYGNAPVDIVLNWGPLGIAAPFATETSTELLINAATLTAGHDALLTVGFPTVGLTGDSNGLELVPDATATETLFAIAHVKTRAIDTYGSFADLVAALETDLTGTKTLLQLSAVGPYSVTAGTAVGRQAAARPVGLSAGRALGRVWCVAINVLRGTNLLDTRAHGFYNRRPLSPGRPAPRRTFFVSLRSLGGDDPQRYLWRRRLN